MGVTERTSGLEEKNILGVKRGKNVCGGILDFYGKKPTEIL